MSPRIRQILTIARLEQRRVFFSKRGLWVYLLALFPAFIFLVHGVDTRASTKRYTAIGLTAPAVLDQLQPGMTQEQVETIGPPVRERSWERGNRQGEAAQYRQLQFFDGRRQAYVDFKNEIVEQVRLRNLISLEEDREIFAGVFHYFYLRLAIFFGCLGIFMNLFRGEMLDKTLHYWLLAPVRRETLLLGKYVAGLTAALVIFSLGAVLCYLAMLWPQESSEVAAFWRTYGLSHLAGYVGAAVLACIGYGSFFLAAGVLIRNPIVPAAILLLWEGISNFLPAALRKLSVLHYAQALAPTPPPLDPNTPALIRLLLVPADPPPAFWAVLGLLCLAAAVLWLASRRIHTIEINYSTD